MTTLKEALSNVSWKSIESRLIELYPDQRSNLEGYEHVYTELLTLTPADNPDYESIDIEWIPSDKHFGDEFGFYSVAIFNPRKHRLYAATFYSWEDWLALYVKVKAEMPLIDVVCHALYEMTYYGFSRSKVEEKQNRIASAFEKAFRSLASEGGGR